MIYLICTVIHLNCYAFIYTPLYQTTLKHNMKGMKDNSDASERQGQHTQIIKTIHRTWPHKSVRTAPTFKNSIYNKLHTNTSYVNRICSMWFQ